LKVNQTSSSIDPNDKGNLAGRVACRVNHRSVTSGFISLLRMN